jgi:hypothetical protein
VRIAAAGGLLSKFGTNVTAVVCAPLAGFRGALRAAALVVRPAVAAPDAVVQALPGVRAVVAVPDAQVVTVARDASVEGPGVAVRAVPVAPAVPVVERAVLPAAAVALDARVEVPDVAVRAALLAQAAPAAA